jgi:hypothetical protein
MAHFHIGRVFLLIDLKEGRRSNTFHIEFDLCHHKNNFSREVSKNDQKYNGYNDLT